MNYMKPSQLSKLLGINRHKLVARMHEMMQFVGYGKEYPPSALLMDDGTTRVDLDAFMDFCNRREELCAGK